MLLWQSLSSTIFSEENGVFPTRWVTGPEGKCTYCPCRAWQGAPAEESQVPRAEQKKSEIKALFASLLPGVTVLELLKWITPNHD